MHYPVGIVWQSVDLALLGLIDLEFDVFRGLECALSQALVESQEIALAVLVELPDAPLALTLPCFLVGERQVLH